MDIHFDVAFFNLSLSFQFFFRIEQRTRLYSGIAKDVQRQQQHKIENTYRLQQQIELTKVLKENEATE